MADAKCECGGTYRIRTNRPAGAYVVRYSDCRSCGNRRATLHAPETIPRRLPRNKTLTTEMATQHLSRIDQTTENELNTQPTEIEQCFLRGC